MGDFTSPPAVAFGSVWACGADPGSSIVRLTPTTLHNAAAELDPGRVRPLGDRLRRAVAANDVPSGNVIRFDPADGRLAGAIRVTAAPPDRSGRGLKPTAIAAGAGAIWVTVSD